MSENTEKRESWGAWKKQTAKGEVINFSIGEIRYSMWPNSYKTEDKHPDYKIVVNDYVPQQSTNQVTNSVTDNITDLPF